MYEKCANYSGGGPVSAVEAALLETLCRNASGAAVEAEAAEGAADWAASSVLQRAVAVVVPLLFGLIVLLGLVGNALVVLVVAANQQMRSTTNLLIINLASADLLFIVFCVPSTATDYLLPFWPFGDAWCKVVQYLIVVTCYASVYTLVLMSLDRYLAVVHPVSSMGLRTQRHALSAIAVTWVVILAACAPVYTSHGVVGYDFEKAHHTACVFLEATHNKPAFQISFFLTSYVLPLLLIVSLYLRMLMRLWRAGAPGGHLSAESRRGKKRVTRMVVVVVAIFAVCWCPIQVILVLKTVGMYDITTAKVMLQIVSHVLAYMNSCVNPILYAFLSDNFRKAFRKVIYCGPAGGGAQRGRSMGQRGRPDGAAVGAGAAAGADGGAPLRPLHAHTANGTKTTRADASTDDLL